MFSNKKHATHIHPVKALFPYYILKSNYKTWG
jgi:hypothetical protein